MGTTVAVTGAAGFLGWHLRCRMLAVGGYEVVVVDRLLLNDDSLSSELSRCAAVVHLAGVNRGSDTEVEEGNIALAERLVEGLEQTGSTPHVIFGNSNQTAARTPYGRGKSGAARVLRDWAQRREAPFTDLILPNLFGEHGRPHYNSFVATFCDVISRGGAPEVSNDRPIALLHAQQAAQSVLDVLTSGRTGRLDVEGVPHLISEVLARLVGIAGLYRSGDIAPLESPLDRQLFNTYRSFFAPDRLPILLTPRADQRGELVECVRAHGGQGQTFVSTTRPGQVRGQHFHLEKVERFVVLKGEAQISLRRLFADDVVRLRVRGDDPVAVDMPTMWTHALTNTGRADITTLFWSHELYDPARPDTFAEPVER